MPPTPAVQDRVKVGVQTVAGYAASAGSFFTPLIAAAADANLPVPVQVTLIIVGGALAGITGRNRSDQAVANAAVAEAKAYNGPPDLGEIPSSAREGLPAPDGTWPA